MISPLAELEANCTQIEEETSVNYELAEQQFIKLLATENLDKKLDADPSQKNEFEYTLAVAISAAYQNGAGDDSAHRFLQRILYRINRLNMFWYDDLHHYINERSPYLHKVREQIETAWQDWELGQIDVVALQQLNVKQALIERAAKDLELPFSEDSRYIREEMSETGYPSLTGYWLIRRLSGKQSPSPHFRWRC